MQIEALERRTAPSRSEFSERYLSGQGHPVIIEGALDSWPAMKKWSFEYFQNLYGSDIVNAPLGLSSEVGKITRLDRFIEYLEDPDSELPGAWTMRGLPTLTAPARKNTPHYLLGWKGFQRHPELFEDILPAPDFIEDWTLALDPTVRDVLEWTSGVQYWDLFIGPKDSFSPLHQDFWNTHNYLVQFRGTKRVFLFPPSDAPFLYGGAADPSNPDFDKFPLFENASGFEGVLKPGDLLLMPGNWWHWVRGLEKSITMSHNFITERNFSEHLANLFRRLPGMVKGFEKFPSWKEELSIKWRGADFQPAPGAQDAALRGPTV